MTEKQEQGSTLCDKPVAWLDEEKKIIYWHNTHETDDYHGFKRTTPLYTTPQQRTTEPERQWIGLMDDEIAAEAIKEEQAYGFIQGVAWAEAKLKEKNV